MALSLLVQEAADRVGEAFRILPNSIPELCDSLNEYLSPQASHLPGLAAAIKGAEDQFFSAVLPDIVRRAKLGKELFAEDIDFLTIIPDSKSPECQRVSLTNEQAASLLSSMFLCSLGNPGIEDMPWATSFIMLHQARYPSEGAKLVMFVNFFFRISDGQELAGHLHMIRSCVPESMTFFDTWRSLDCPLKPVTVSGDAMIEGDYRNIQMDFANESIGGGVISGGCVQEEIRFSINPLLTTSLAVCAIMQRHEALFFIGSEQYSAYKGYARSLRFGGDYVDETPRLDDGSVACCISAIDAIPYAFSSMNQRRDTSLMRDIVKAYAGFKIPNVDCTTMWQDAPIATGNWGCGAFGGNRTLKSVLQWIAASAAGHELLYCSFCKDKVWQDGFSKLVEKALAKQVTVGQLVRMLFDNMQLIEHLDDVHEELAARIDQLQVPNEGLPPDETEDNVDAHPHDEADHSNANTQPAAKAVKCETAHDATATPTQSPVMQSSPVEQLTDQITLV